MDKAKKATETAKPSAAPKSSSILAPELEELRNVQVNLLEQIEKVGGDIAKLEAKQANDHLSYAISALERAVRADS